MQSVRDAQKRTDKTVEVNHKETQEEFGVVKAKLDSLESQLNALKKQLGLLDDKVKGIAKAAISGGGGGGSNIGASLLDDLEKAV